MLDAMNPRVASLGWHIGNRARWLLVSSLASLLLVPACKPPDAFELPGPKSQSASATGSFRAGFGRVDITPPPGFGLFGYGPEGKRARGYRTRLYARAMVLEDAAGQIIAFAVADLDVISTLLHRRVAQLILQQTDSAIGADRLILSATHTHSGPAHFLSAWTTNEFGSGVAGHAPRLVDSLSHGIARAVMAAYDGRRPARAAWAIDAVWGHTRNRSMAAYRLNRRLSARPLEACPQGYGDVRCSVNPHWAMLRVDTIGPGGTHHVAGSLSIFAIHGTGFPSGNDLYEADIHGLVARTLEDSLGGIHLMANGAEGDVSPDVPESTRCAAARIRPTRRPGGPRTPPPKDDWHDAPPEELAACVRRAKPYVKEVSAALADSARMIHAGVAAALRSDILIARAFETVDLTSEAAYQAGLCRGAEIGTAAVAGAPDGRTRYAGFKLLGLIPLGFEPGGGAIDSSRTDCQGPKRSILLRQSRLVGSLGFPEYTQLAAVRVGDFLVGTVPGEASSEAGWRMLDSMRTARPESVPPDNLALIGLALGDLRYVPTEEEYGAQRYEGGSDLYGPQTANFVAARLRALTARLGSPDGGDGVGVGEIWVRPGQPVSLWPDTGPRPDSLRFDGDPGCRGDTVVARWYDAPAGSMVPASGPVLEFRRERDGIRADDGDVDTEVRGLGGRGKGYLWEARWTPPNGIEPGDQFSLTLLRWEGPATVRIRCE
jgi:neutral ceramidase